MPGIRVCKVPKEFQEKHLKIYFSKPTNGGGDIDKIYFPLNNNDAVIIFKEPKVVEHIIKRRHMMSDTVLEVQCLPENMIFTSLEAQLDTNATVLLQAYGNVLDEMKYDKNIKVIEGSDGTLRLKGSWFQLEWAWHYIDCYLQHQEIIQSGVKHPKNSTLEIEEDTTDVLAQSHRSKSPSDVNLSLRMSISERSRFEDSLRHASSLGYPSSNGSTIGKLDRRMMEKENGRHPGSIEEQSSSVSMNTLKSNIGHTYTDSHKPIHALESEHYSYGEYEDTRHQFVGETNNDDFELIGQGHKVPFESVHSTLNMGHRGRREDENSVFEEFSGLRSMQRQLERSEARNHSATNSSTESLTKAQLHNTQTKYKSLTPEESLKSITARSMDRSRVSPAGSTLEQSQKPYRDLQTEDMHATATKKPYSSLPPDFTHLQTSACVPDSKQSVTRQSPDPLLATDMLNRFTASTEPRYSPPVSATRSALTPVHVPDRYTEDQLSCQFDIRGVNVTVYYGDITKEETEVIVNAANEDLDHNGGVAYALLKARGQEMQHESNEYTRKHGRLKTTEVMHTSGGGELRASHIIHAAGPMWFAYNSHKQEEISCQIAQTFLNCLMYADKLWVSSIAMPAISTGVYGAPLDACVRAFLDAILVYVNNISRDRRRVRDIRLVNNDAEATVTSIVLLQTVLDEGIDNLTKRALEMFQKYEEKDQKLNLPKGRPERSGSFSRTITQTGDSLGRSSREISQISGKSSHRRSSSLSRISDKSKVDKSHSYDKSGSSQRGKASKLESDRGSERRGSRERTSSELESERGSERRGTRERTSSVSSAKTVSTSRERDSKKQYGIGTGGRISPRTAARLPATPSPRAGKSAPQIKQSLLTSDKIKSFHVKGSTTGGAGSRHMQPSMARMRSSDEMMMMASPRSSGSPKSMKSDLLHYSRDERHEEEMSMHSLPADLGHDTSYREKFLQMSQPQHEKKKSPVICAICLDEAIQPKPLPICKHVFCKECIGRHFRTKPTCPICNTRYGETHGDQPKEGKMSYMIKRDMALPGFEREDGIIIITYSFPDGIQKAGHPNPGKTYKGLNRKAYLPNSVEGREILRMLQKAFDMRLVFTIGQSRTTGAYGVLTWNDLHHKTNVSGGPTKYGYPDENYLQRIRDELADKGITSDR